MYENLLGRIYSSILNYRRGFIIKNIKNIFLKLYNSKPYIIQKKSEYLLVIVIVTLFFLSLMLLFNIFIFKSLIYITSKIIFLMLCAISLFFLRKGKLEKAINYYFFAYVLEIFIDCIIVDLLSIENLTHYRVLTLVTVLIVGFIIMSLISIRRYQTLLILYSSCLFTALDSSIIYLKYYSDQISGDIIGNFIIYIILILGGCIFGNLLLKMNAESIEIVDRQNEVLQLDKIELEKTVKGRTNELTFMNERLKELVYYDTLTELSNRKKMHEDVDLLLNNKNKKFAFLFIDLDKFKNANDNYGHLAGDNILKTAAVRLKSIISLTDEVYRIGGDEFIIILRNLKATADAEKIAVAALEKLSAAFTYKENQLFIGGSIGISIFSEHGIDEDTISKKADLAMYEVKRAGGNGYKIYTSNLREEDFYI